MPNSEIRLPALGEGIIEATLTRILCPVGSRVEAEQAIAEVATDKVDTEVMSSEAGWVDAIFYTEGQVVPVGGLIATVRATETPSVDEQNPATPAAYVEKVEQQIAQLVLETESPTTTKHADGNRLYLSPLVRSMAQAEGITEAQLAEIKGSGLDGRLTKTDIQTYLVQRAAQPKTAHAQATTPIAKAAHPPMPPAPTPPADTDRVVMPGTELVEMDRMRRLIADHMVRSKQTSPHVSSFVEVDMTPIVLWRQKHKAAFEAKYGQKLTFTPFFVEATAKALRDFPMVNVSVEGYTIVKKNFVNIGMATALPSGNLIVPVIKNADQQNLAGLAASVNDLADRARLNKLKPDEIAGSTFTITNVGSFGNITGTPIINQPEVAILAVGMIQKKPAVIETPQGDTLGIRHQMILALSYDHRVVDGSLGGMFLRRVADYLERFDPARVV